MPDWVKPLPYGELSCVTQAANGLKWDEKEGKYFQTRYPSRTYIIQRLNTPDPNYTKNDCKIEESSNYNEFDDSYTRSTCYRFNNVSNFIGWTQTWCKETYMRSGPIYVTCDYKNVSQPKIGFSPSGYFYAYGHTLHGTLSKPGLEDVYIESGYCKAFKKGYQNKFNVFGKEIYYALED
ncbi:hypothetical protein N9W89_07610 [Hellea sp.]|nr:hypothetical protein [Hellea sp.]